MDVLDYNTPILEEDTPYERTNYINPDEHKKSSTFQIFLHLFKSNIGVGVLNMPQTLSRAGILLGPVVSLLCIIPIIHCMLLLLKCSREIKKRTNKKAIGYAGTFRYSFIEHIGPYSRYLVYVGNFYLLASQLGVCTVYITFAAETLYSVTEKPFDIRLFMLMIGLLIIPLVFVTRLDVMSILSGGANALCLFSLICTLGYILRDVKSPKNYPMIGDMSKFPLFISSVMYVFEGINVVIPLDNEIAEPDRYPFVLKLATYLCGFIYFSFGLLGYLAYGSHALDSVTLNLPIQPFTNVVKIVYAIGIIMTFFIQFHIAMSVMMPTILKKVPNRSRHTLVSSITRFFFASLILFLAIAIPQMKNLISFIGAFSCTSLSLIFPCIIHMATFWNTQGEDRLTRSVIIKDISIIILGSCLAVVGVFASIAEIVKEYKLTPD
ncbi:Proton-coupled amino acid transporter 1 [Thelohanellus kitauei]|uniref:Proton-coupled amino acid transporter 1 n=1 Tax=Thelohanellus kitauei TaxID=669202 RepID=A0A0C2MV53_THEKT|nr:Proton-coupled amino acid transporter 1 [Thelohanellus kitauei]